MTMFLVQVTCASIHIIIAVSEGIDPLFSLIVLLITRINNLLVSKKDNTSFLMVITLKY